MYIPCEHEMEAASNSYLMSLLAAMAGLPFPIINLLATVIFYLANLDPSAYRGDVIVRGKMRLEAWNPHTGESAPVSVRYEKQGKEMVTRLTLDLPEHHSLFLLER